MEENRQKKKESLEKLKDAVEDKEHQIEVLGTFVRLGVAFGLGSLLL